MRQPAPLGLGHAVLCAKRAVGNDPFAVLLADDFIVGDKKGVTSDLVNSFKKNKKIQLSVMDIFGPEISNYGVVKFNSKSGNVEGLVEKPKQNLAPSNSASISASGVLLSCVKRTVGDFFTRTSSIQWFIFFSFSY